MEEVISKVEEKSVVSTKIKKVPVAISDSVNTDIGRLAINTEDNTLDINETEIETTLIKILQTPLGVQIQNANTTNVLEDPILLQRNTDEESVNSGNTFVFIC